MTEYNKTRRTFMKGAAATGVAATGITAFSGSAAAQDPDPGDFDVDTSRLNVNQQTGNLRGLIILNNINVDIIDDITLENINVQILYAEDEARVIEVSRLIQTNGGDVIRLIIRDNIRDILQDFDNLIVQVTVLGQSEVSDL
jgi:hypothetical protein